MLQFENRTIQMIVIALLYLFVKMSQSSFSIEVYTFANFPKHKIALHFPCQESNMFATKCMCHLKCTDPTCDNAKKVCEKYHESEGCKYLLIRGSAKKIATLKRVPTLQELQRFNISSYPSSWEKVDKSYLKNLKETQRLLKINKTMGPNLGNYVSSLAQTGHYITDRIFHQKEMSHYCGDKYFGDHHNSSYLFNQKKLFLSRGIALAALSYHSPLTLLNSIKTWNSSGLLNLVSEKVMILNDPRPPEYLMSHQFGFNILQPMDIKNAKMSKPNVFTIGAAFYYALISVESEYVLFLENDFKMDTSLSVADIESQLLTAAGMLERGAEIVRLQSRKYQGCGTFKDCHHHGINLLSDSPIERLRNWFAFYCRDHKNTGQSVSDCFRVPDFRCFTSWDTNWTLNAVMVKKSTMLNKLYPRDGKMISIANIGLNQFEKQDGFESVMIYGNPSWMEWKVPVCISYEGLFIHEEIETST